MLSKRPFLTEGLVLNKHLLKLLIHVSKIYRFPNWIVKKRVLKLTDMKVYAVRCSRFTRLNSLCKNIIAPLCLSIIPHINESI